jgi:hypothetical protein
VASRLDGDDGFGPRGGARRRHELPRIGNGFEVENDGAGPGVASEEIQAIGYVDVGHVAERDDLRKPHTVVGRPVDQRGRNRARLGQKRDVIEHLLPQAIPFC